MMCSIRILFLLFACAVCNAQTPPTLAMQIVGGFARLTVSAQPGIPCTIYYATNLIGPTNWFALTNITIGSTSAVVLDQTTRATNSRFYKAIISVPVNGLWIPAGTFVMGSPTNESQRGPNSETQHSVTLTKGVFMSRYLVTQSKYLSLMNTNPSYFNTNRVTLDLNRPVETVSWANAVNFCAALTVQERAAGRLFTNWVYRLPTEAEWEYACRAGTTTPLYYGNNLTNGMANFDGQYAYYLGNASATNDPNGVFLNKTLAVGSYQPNAFGLYDMAGSVWEWCQDWYGAFTAGSVADPQGPGAGTERVLRGGAFNSTGASCRSANRSKTNPALGGNTIGFRVVAAGP
jgi:formylglycine-generating enzyme required for sulfatase activity